MLKNYSYIILLSLLLPTQNSFFEKINSSNNEEIIRFNLSNSEAEKIIKNNRNPSYGFLFYIKDGLDYTIEYDILSSIEVDSSLLNQNIDFVQNNFDVSESIFRNLRILNINIYPFKYNIDNSIINLINSIDIKINYYGDETIYNKKYSEVFDNLYKDYVLNYEQIERNEFQKPSILYICGGSSETNSAFRDLTKWRHSQGFVVNTVSSNQIGNSTTNIKNYISNAYYTWDNPPEFICIVGDANGSYSVPTYIVSEGTGWNGAEGEGDFPYSLIDGNDLLPEIIIGRMSIRSSSELNTVVNKIIKYEQAEAGVDWLESVALVGDPYTASGISTVITNEYIEQLMDTYGMEDIRTKYSGNNFDDWMVDQINDGISYLNYRGIQGFSDFTSNDVNQLNNGFKLPLVTTITCATGSFQQESTCISEALFRAGSSNNPAGAVAVIGTSTSYTHTAFNNIVDMGIYEGIFVRNAKYAGEALSFGRLALLNTYPDNPNNNVYLFSTWNNLMGDPATLLWTDTPTYLGVNHNNDVSFGTNYFEVNVVDSNDNSKEGVRITIIKGDDEIFESELTDYNGRAVFNLDYISEGTVDVTATCHNCVPSLSNFIITDNSSEINCSIENQLIDNGNNDGQANPGETIIPIIDIQNNGSIDLENLTIKLESNSDYVNLINSQINDISILSNQAFTINNLSFLILDNIQDMVSLDLYITIYNTNSNWTFNLPISVYSGSVNLALSILEDENNNNIFDKGETATVDIIIKNDGSIDLSNVTGSINFNDDTISFNNIDLIWGDVKKGESVSLSIPIEITVTNNIVNGYLINIPIDIQTMSNYSISSYIPITIGVVSETDPIGPDSYGYYIYGIEDDEYIHAPSYEWIEIDPDYGGQGNILDIDDNGDNQDESTILDLPFDFNFYGVTYNQITVCSNGWVSFGASNMASFRNYHLPGPGGPSPMIAAFWDDLKTNSGGDVISLYDEINNRLIIQWSDVRTYQYNDQQTFQIIINNDGWMMPNGDGSIKIQYKDFNNTTNGYYPVGNNGGAVIHGAYASVGIENHYGNIGIEYTYNNEYPNPAASELSDGSALLITTQMPGIYSIPAINFNTNMVSFDLLENQNDSFNLLVSNDGEVGSLLYYSLDESPFLYPFTDNNIDGYSWSHSNIDTSFEYNWIDISSDYIELEFENNDTATEAIDIGFDFKYYENSYSSCIVNPNGWIGFGSDIEDGWNNLSIYDDEAPKNAIFAFWDDLNPSLSGNEEGSGTIKYKAMNDKFIVWYDNVIHWTNDERIYNFQVVLNNNGTIDINYKNLQGSVTSATVGIINSDGSLGHQVVNNSDLLDSEMSIKFSPETSWINISLVSEEYEYDIPYGETAIININVSSNDLSYGVYSSNLIIQSNAGDTTIPVIMNLGDNNDLLYGDLNQDGVVDILDIVRQIAIIMGQIIPTMYEQAAADINQDGTVDILDVVLTINIIID